ncbi:hypothetical protein NQ318_009967 [Aromia moschata]|uniref:Bms1-type G domain-containing protein n=1 Tax=Aromia moschata TaxID=1265417 RepID=A0AAV8YBR4_9CUCU|nr:hypothetical protein NQ318_009967 [Aromia moschata]
MEEENNLRRKAEKKKTKKDAANPVVENVLDKKQNPKAFAFNSAIRAERRFRRKQDIETKRQHIPLVDRTPVEPPPIFVAVVGPPKVGKTTLIRNLIKLFTRTPLTDIKGPVTIVMGKKRRVTFMECNNDVNSMIDLAKVADLVLLLCDASFGFEMEIFEFLNICQVHGMPKIMGVLTHLDMIKNSKVLKTTKKTLKHRFWTEVYPGAKLFYLSGIIHGEYLRNEIKNLGRFLSVMKLRPLKWRSTHSYLIADRYEDLTSQESIRKDPKCDRNISLYGYVRGVPLRKATSVHIAGLGDLRIQDISYLPDPCPLPEQIKKRALSEKEKSIYSPFSGVGGIVYDKDAVYIELGGSHGHQKREDNELNNIIANLIDTKETLDIKMKYSELQLFSGGEKISAQDMEDRNIEKNIIQFHGEIVNRREEKGLNSKQQGALKNNDPNTTAQKNFDDSSDSNSESEDSSDESVSDVTPTTPVNTSYGGGSNDDQDIEWKDNLAKKAHESFLARSNSNKNWMKIVYGRSTSDRPSTPTNDVDDSEDEGSIGGIFKKVRDEEQRRKTNKGSKNAFDSSLPMPWDCPTRDWLEEDNKALIKDCFVTGKWAESEDAAELLKLDDAEDLSDSELDGDFEDLETGEKHEATTMPSKKQGEKRKRNADNANEENDRQMLAEKKRKLKEKFDAEYDNTDTSYYDSLKMSADKQANLNKKILENMPDDMRIKIEGYRPGMYVRMEFENIPAEFINNFDPTYPIVIGSLNVGEENVGYVNVKLKKHRWYSKILKTNDPLIFSLGWRRFQSIPLYSKLEDDMKFRYIKYTRSIWLVTLTFGAL